MRKIVVVAATVCGAAMPLSISVMAAEGAVKGGSPDAVGVEGDKMKSDLGVEPPRGNPTSNSGASTGELGSQSTPQGSADAQNPETKKPPNKSGNQPNGTSQQ